MDTTPKDPVNYNLRAEDFDGNFNEFLETVTDVPSSPSLHPINIDEAGITNQQVYIQIRDIDGRENIKPMLCNIEIGVRLEGHRGIHMSRCEEALFALSREPHDSIDSFAVALAKLVRDKQESKGCVVKVTGIYIHDHPTKVTGRISEDKIYLLSEASVDGDGEKVKTGVKAFNINACPCTRAYTKYSAVPALQQKGFTPDQIRDILNIVVTGSHTQRGTISVVIDKTSEEITTSEIYRIIDGAAHLVYELLKRSDEHELVTRALNHPQFTEDVAREVALGIFRRFRDVVPPETRLRVESILQDSIHIHDVKTRIDTDFGRITKSIENEAL